MLRQGRFPLTLHAAVEPLLVVLFLVAPLLFGFSDRAGPTALSIVVGLGIMVEAASTEWRLSLVQVVPVTAHAIIDACLGVALIAFPFLFGFSDLFGATVFFMVAGIGLVLGFLGTEWRPDRAGGSPRGGRGRRAKPA